MATTPGKKPFPIGARVCIPPTVQPLPFPYGEVTAHDTANGKFQRYQVRLDDGRVVYVSPGILVGEQKAKGLGIPAGGSSTPPATPPALGSLSPTGGASPAGKMLPRQATGDASPRFRTLRQSTSGFVLVEQVATEQRKWISLPDLRFKNLDEAFFDADASFDPEYRPEEDTRKLRSQVRSATKSRP